MACRVKGTTTAIGFAARYMAEPARGKPLLTETCFRCGAGETGAVLFPCRHEGKSQWVCARCLPPLIHG